MQLDICGEADKVTNQQMADAVHFYAEYLMSDRLLRNIHIEVVVETDLIRNEKDQAYCVSMSDSGAAREFEISIDAGLGKRAMLLALAHEMVHVKQYARGELKYNSRQRLHRFQGVSYSPQHVYWEQPWEIEAFGRELGLYRMFTENQKAQRKCKK
jgi:hypothetical protein